MKKSFKVALLILLLVAAAAASGLYISDLNIDVLNPKGMIGIKERDLIVTSSLLMLIVVVPVFILTLFFAGKYREGRNAKHTPDWEHNSIAEYCWWGVPFVIIVILAVITLRSSYELNPFKPIESDKKPITIQVVALQWKWLFIYPDHGIATVNFIQFPEQTPINFEITADAPMNSFWIPALGGQIYAMPAMRSKLHLIANETGSFRGVSANISGDGFSGMTFTAKSSSQDEFDNWVASVKQTSKPLSYDPLIEPTSYVPPASYLLVNYDLFEQIIMKYMMPPKG